MELKFTCSLGHFDRLGVFLATGLRVSTAEAFDLFNKEILLFFSMTEVLDQVLEGLDLLLS